MIDYKLMYDRLYSLGYHMDGTNSGVAFVDSICNNFQFQSILDVGCSQGNAVREYLRMGKDASGIDISESAISEAHTLTKEKDQDRFMIGSVLQIPYADKTFDAIVSTDVLEHLSPEDVDQAIAELVRVSKGWLFLKIAKSPEGVRKWIDLLKERYPEDYTSINNLHLSPYPVLHWRKKLMQHKAMPYTLPSSFPKKMTVYKVMSLRKAK